jgi:CRISPR-associated protein Cas2
MRQRYIVTYDIRDPRRLRQVFRTLKGYGEHLQLSVFRCDLTRMALAQLKDRLSACLNAREDQVLLIDIGPAEGRAAEAVESLGRACAEMQKGPAIV